MERLRLQEIFGFDPSDQSEEAVRHRQHRYCPFNNIGPHCTKDKRNDPLGVCSINVNGKSAIICPVRFRENWRVVDHAADFLFPQDATFTSLSEIRLKDSSGKPAGNIDLVLVQYDEHGRVLDFGGVEVQGVYINGNIRTPFETAIARSLGEDLPPSAEVRFRPDYLSSSRKRLVPQLLYKGGILNAWRKKLAVALDRGFFDTFPALPRVDREEAEIAWLVYDLVRADERFTLSLSETVYTRFQDCIDLIAKASPGPVDRFIQELQKKLDKKLQNSTPPPDSQVDLI